MGENLTLLEQRVGAIVERLQRLGEERRRLEKELAALRDRVAGLESGGGAALGRDAAASLEEALRELRSI
jgi:phage shock protein A